MPLFRLCYKDGFWLNSVKHLQSYASYLSIIPFVSVKTREPHARNLKFYIEYSEYINILDPPPPKPPPRPKEKKYIYIILQIWILCQNSLTRSQIRAVKFVL